MQILMVKSMLYYTVKGETNLSKYDVMGDRRMTNLNTIYNLIKKERQELTYKLNNEVIEAHKRMIDKLVKEYKEGGGRREN